MKFPKKLRHNGKGRVLATIYKRPNSYRLYWRVRGADGKPRSRFKDFVRYADAKRAGDKQVTDLSKGRATTLTPGQLNDAIAAFERAAEFYRETGKRISLHDGITQICAAIKKLNDTPVPEAIDRYLSSVATVKRKRLCDAVNDFISEREPLTKAKGGKRPPLSLAWHQMVSRWLREFSDVFPNYDLCDFTKDLVDTYFGKFQSLTPKTRNERRNTLRQFFKWCTAKDYLSRNHRLNEASKMQNENDDPDGDIELYTASEVRKLLEAASKIEEHRCILPIIALAAFGGCRQQEAMRLNWENVFREDNHIEISTAKSKTRARRLIEAPANLFAWLEPYRKHTGLVWAGHRDTFHAHYRDLLAEVKLTMKENGLRHAFISHSFALDGNENRVSMMAGNTPDMVHRHYKGLVTRKQAEAYFNLVPGDAQNVIALATAAHS